MKPLHSTHYSEPELEALARLLWPDSPRNQAAWMRAISVLRTTKLGWLVEPDTPPPEGEDDAPTIR